MDKPMPTIAIYYPLQTNTLFLSVFYKTIRFYNLNGSS